MNNETALTVQDSSESSDVPVNSNFLGSGRQRNGKVARLPKEMRDRINQMLLDGKPYTDIVASLGPEGAHVSDDNIGNWKSGGYQDWLRQQQRIEVLRGKQEFAMDLVRDKDGSRVHQATLQIAAANLCELLIDLDPITLRELIEEEPDKYTRLLNAIVRLSDGQLKAERYTNEAAEKQAALAKPKLPAQPGGISDEALEAAEARLNLL